MYDYFTLNDIIGYFSVEPTRQNDAERFYDLLVPKKKKKE